METNVIVNMYIKTRNH